MRRLKIGFIYFALVIAVMLPATVSGQTADVRPKAPSILPPATQLFLGPTGRALPKGDSYLKVIGLGVPMVQGALTDRFSIGIGATVPAVFITPKLQVQRSANHATSIGTMTMASVFGGASIGYAAHTVETSAGAVHVAVLQPIASGSHLGDVGVMIGGEHRVSDRVMFMTENYLLGPVPILSGGVRMRAAHTTWDLGWFTMLGVAGSGPGTPMINVGYRF